MVKQLLVFASLGLREARPSAKERLSTTKSRGFSLPCLSQLMVNVKIHNAPKKGLRPTVPNICSGVHSLAFGIVGGRRCGEKNFGVGLLTSDASLTTRPYPSTLSIRIKKSSVIDVRQTTGLYGLEYEVLMVFARVADMVGATSLLCIMLMI